MNTQRAAERTIEKIDISEYWTSRAADGKTIGHALWMLEGIVQGYIQHEKAHRWLGYAQGILVSNGATNLEAMKLANRTSAEERQKT